MTTSFRSFRSAEVRADHDGIRADLLGSHSEALRIFEELIPLTSVVKLSDDDAFWLYPGGLLLRGLRLRSEVEQANLRSARLQWAVVGWPGNSGHTSLTLSHSVMTRSNRSLANRSRCFERWPEISRPRSDITRTAFACSGLG